MGFCLSLVDILVGFLVTLFVGFGLLRGLLVLAIMWESCIGLMPFPRFLGEVLSDFALFG